MKIRGLLTVFAVVAPMVLVADGAFAVPMASSRSAIPPSVAFISEGDAELAPLAHVKFCMQNASECGEPGRASDASIDADRVGLLERVNREVNRRIRPRAKFASIGEWAINPSSGDCNDYAVTKRHMLVALGLPAGALRLAVVRTNWGEGHLVLVARTQSGDYVLDNLSNHLTRWDETGHAFLKIQSASDARNWTGVERGRSAPVVVATMSSEAAADEDEEWYLGQP